jgi:hypothetical protein
MPRNGSGTQSVPNTFVDQTTITAGAHNANWSDAAAEITNSMALDGQSQMSGPLKIASGSVTAPGLVPGSDLDTGLYRIGGDNLGVACAGAKVLDIGTAGLDVTGALTVGSAAVYRSGGTDVAVADGGTGASTATAGFNALAPTTTRGDLITRDASNNVRLAIGAANRVLRSDGTDPSWGQVVNGDITDGTIAYAKLASGATAAQSDMETGTSTATIVTPGRQHFHPGHPKAGGNFDGTGTPAFRSGDYGMGAITDNGFGDWALALDTAFSNTNYWVIGMSRSNADSAVGDPRCGPFQSSAKTASSYTIRNWDAESDGSQDSTEVGVSFWGDYA